jgi:hypothetical protein
LFFFFFLSGKKYGCNLSSPVEWSLQNSMGTSPYRPGLAEYYLGMEVQVDREVLGAGGRGAGDEGLDYAIE